VELLHEFYGPWCLPGTVTGNALFELDGPDASGCFILTGPDSVWHGRNATALVVELQTRLDDYLLERTPYAPIHAGAVALDGRALLIPGMSRTGKSSLVAALIARGAAYLSDEYALLDGDGRVHPYARPLLLRVPGSEPEARTAVPATRLTASIASSPARVSAIAALRYSDEAELWLERVPSSEGLLYLLQNTPRVVRDDDRTVTAAMRALRTARVYRGRRGDAEAAVEPLLALLAE
jgi:outer membrane receptor protein involved in Fe transport